MPVVCSKRGFEIGELTGPEADWQVETHHLPLDAQFGSRMSTALRLTLPSCTAVCYAAFRLSALNQHTKAASSWYHVYQDKVT